MHIFLVLTAAVAAVNGDACTSHVLTGTHAGTHGVGCMKASCCADNFKLASLCSGSDVCCFSHDTCGSSSGGNYNCYGDVMKLHPAGASARTSSGLGYSGVQASNHMVDQDYAELSKRKSCYVRAGANNCIHPAVVAGVASRETRGGKLLYSTGGWGDHHHAWGIMQCDVFASGLGSTCQKYAWDSCDHIDQMTRIILVPYIKQVKAKHPTWSPEQQMQGGVSAYNAGVGNVATWAHLDVGTTGNDYSNDVIARAQHLIKQHGW
uniref:Goose-type lysozyme n=1 Tax=Haliotis discus discus TaxID=91233 RepID=U5KC09_HALDI|nr:goose-type lysozyme [Haliotis discus discus]AGQ50337.1 goose-type lysozyme [Haliotis discus discus]